MDYVIKENKRPLQHTALTHQLPLTTTGTLSSLTKININTNTTPTLTGSMGVSFHKSPQTLTNTNKLHVPKKQHNPGCHSCKEHSTTPTTTTHSRHCIHLRSLVPLTLFLLTLSTEASSSRLRPILISRPNDTSIGVSWENFANQKRLRKFPCGVEYFKVKLRFADKTIQNWQVGDAQRSLQIDDPYLKKLRAVQVKALMCDGMTVYKTSWLKINSSKNHNIRSLLEPPSSFSVVAIESKVLVRWQANKANANIEGYIVSYGEGVPDIMFKYVPINHHNVTLEKLKYSTVYVVGIRTFYKSLQSEALYKNIKTEEKPSLGLETPRSEASTLPAPVMLRLKTLSSGSIELEWKDSSLYGDQRILDERFYIVHYTNLKTQQNTSIIVKALHVTIHNLEADCWYVFKVRIGKGALSSPFTDGIPGKTLKMDLENRRFNKHSDKEKKTKRNHRHQKKEAKKERKLKRHQRNHQAYRSPPKTPYNHHHHSFKKSYLNAQNRQVINMKKKIHINVGAFITWPRTRHTVCSPPPMAQQNLYSASSTPESSVPAPLYSFRFKRVGDYAFSEEDLNDNFKYVHDLSPIHTYIYQVRYLQPEGQGWSQEEVLKLPKNP